MKFIKGPCKTSAVYAIFIVLRRKYQSIQMSFLFLRLLTIRMQNQILESIASISSLTTHSQEYDNDAESGNFQQGALAWDMIFDKGYKRDSRTVRSKAP